MEFVKDLLSFHFLQISSEIHGTVFPHFDKDI